MMLDFDDGFSSSSYGSSSSNSSSSGSGSSSSSGYIASDPPAEPELPDEVEPTEITLEEPEGTEERLFYPVVIDDELDTGIRIYTSDDTIYEIWEGVETEARIYEDDGMWYGKVRFPETDVEQAYSNFDWIADLVEEEYGVNVSKSVESFNSSLEQNNGHAGQFYLGAKLGTKYTERVSADIEIQYDAEHTIDMPASLLDRLIGSSAHVLQHIGIGSSGTAAVAFGTGALLGEPISLSVSVIAITGLVGFYGGIGSAGVYREGAEKKISRITEWRASKYFEDSESNINSLLGRINERNRIEHLEEAGIETDRDGWSGQLEEVDAEVLDEEWSHTRNLLFDQFHKLEGTTATFKADSYEEAAKFVDTIMTGSPVSLGERPSLYQEPEAFRNIFNHLTFQENGEEHLLSAGKDLVRGVFEEDVHPEIERFLEDEYPELVEDVGEEVLRGEMQ